MDAYTIGQMAQMNRVTKKTLVIYHRMGLLVPEHVDPDTGYRYYTLSQCSTLDMIQQLKHVGLSLAQIKQIIDRRDVSYMHRLIVQQTGKLQRSIKALEFSLATARELSDTCELFMSGKRFCEVTLEYLPKRRILRFPVKPYQVQRRRSQDPQLSNWEKSLRDIKRQLLDEGFPAPLFRNVGCICSKESLAGRDFLCTGGFVFCPYAVEGRESFWEEGYCLTLTIDRTFDDEGNHMEYKHLSMLMDIADANGYAVRDDYYCEIIADTPAFLYSGRDMMLRLRLPVNVENPQSSPCYKST
ncbi:MAG: helix-turn-helix domain-containing protein [Clostridia bacterium]|nr:helix-turn-helix domain-containing protein [Clostridia bacterium]